MDLVWHALPCGDSEAQHATGYGYSAMVFRSAQGPFVIRYPFCWTVVVYSAGRFLSGHSADPESAKKAAADAITKVLGDHL